MRNKKFAIRSATLCIALGMALAGCGGSSVTGPGADRSSDPTGPSAPVTPVDPSAPRIPAGQTPDADASN